MTQGGAQGPQGGMPAGSFDPGQAGPGGMSGGGDRTMLISGTVSRIDGTTLVITTGSGTETEIDVSGATYHAQAAATASDVTVGREVSVAVEGLGFRRPDSSAQPAPGGAPATAPGAVTASEVTLTSAE